MAAVSSLALVMTSCGTTDRVQVVFSVGMSCHRIDLVSSLSTGVLNLIAEGSVRGQRKLLYAGMLDHYVGYGSLCKVCIRYNARIPSDTYTLYSAPIRPQSALVRGMGSGVRLISRSSALNY